MIVFLNKMVRKYYAILYSEIIRRVKLYTIFFFDAILTVDSRSQQVHILVLALYKYDASLTEKDGH